MKDLENHMVLGDYYPEPEPPEDDPDEAREIWLDHMAEEREESNG